MAIFIKPRKWLAMKNFPLTNYFCFEFCKKNFCSLRNEKKIYITLILSPIGIQLDLKTSLRMYLKIFAFPSADDVGAKCVQQTKSRSLSWII